jgi:Mor family transcriptional regulator
VTRKRSRDGVESSLIEAFQRWGKQAMVQELEIDGEIAGRVMRSIVESLCREFGGQAIYVPKMSPWSLSKRDREIAAEFTGTNESAITLAKRCGISVRQIYQIIESERLRRREALAATVAESTAL